MIDGRPGIVSYCWSPDRRLVSMIVDLDGRCVVRDPIILVSPLYLRSCIFGGRGK